MCGGKGGVFSRSGVLVFVLPSPPTNPHSLSLTVQFSNGTHATTDMTPHLTSASSSSAAASAPSPHARAASAASRAAATLRADAPVTRGAAERARPATTPAASRPSTRERAGSERRADGRRGARRRGVGEQGWGCVGRRLGGLVARRVCDGGRIATSRRVRKQETRCGEDSAIPSVSTKKNETVETQHATHTHTHLPLHDGRTNLRTPHRPARGGRPGVRRRRPPEWALVELQGSVEPPAGTEPGADFTAGKLELLVSVWRGC